MSEPADETFRWQGFFQHAAQPMFLVNRRRRILFVNRAWEACTGLKLAEVRGLSCRRRSASSSPDKEDAVLSVCAPPADASAGRSCQVRRRAPGGAAWWEIQFLPLTTDSAPLGILGIIRILAGKSEAPPALPDKLMALRDANTARYRLDDLGGGSPALARLHEQARLAAESRLPITLLGAPGAGKEWLARAIHVRSARGQRYFVRLDAERLPAALLADILFKPQAAPSAIGTIYLRDPALLPRELQGRLTEMLKGRDNPDVPRIILGFSHDPRAEIQAGRLLEEFYYAATPITLSMPPLRERLDELPRFVEIFLKRAGELVPHNVQAVGTEAMNALRSHVWPGNFRELLDVLRAACRRAKGSRIELGDLPFHLKQNALPAERRLPLDKLLEQVERRLIELALRLTQKNQTRAAELLEVWRPRLMRRMQKFGLRGEE
jgi:PAS domain S-box-containing protein